MSQLFSPRFQFVGPTSIIGVQKLSAALNHAATLATGDILLFASDMLEDITIASILSLAKMVHHPKIGIVGPKLLDASKGGSTVFSAGIDFVLGKNPHRPSWTAWYEDLNCILHINHHACHQHHTDCGFGFTNFPITGIATPALSPRLWVPRPMQHSSYIGSKAIWKEILVLRSWNLSMDFRSTVS
jgi:hypothetical protein